MAPAFRWVGRLCSTHDGFAPRERRVEHRATSRTLALRKETDGEEGEENAREVGEKALASLGALLFVRKGCRRGMEAGHERKALLAGCHLHLGERGTLSKPRQTEKGCFS